jgi:predicted AAA+ superfamily ATPase
MPQKRYLVPAILEDLQEKMVFVAGPRQVGKTTMGSEGLAHDYPHAIYLNWDKQADRKKILDAAWPANTDLVILDELHKYLRWKNYIKGEYDTSKKRHRFLVTGSARLDLFRKGGDSLQGRYHLYRLHPLSIAELTGKPKPKHWTLFEALNIPDQNNAETLQALMQFGGFPEPFFAQKEKTLRRWQMERNERLFKEDIRDLERIRDLTQMQILSELLPQKAGSMLSINNLRNDLEVSHKTMTHWIRVLENFYYCFRIYPFVGNSLRSIKKESKLYLWDWALVSDEAARFENLIASHLLKWVNFLQDTEAYKIELYYVRDVFKKEVDFLICIQQKPWFAVEVKMSDTSPAANLKHFKEKYHVPWAYQVVKTPGVHQIKDGVEVVSADRFLAALV